MRESTSALPKIWLDAYGVSDTGHHREQNEDAFVVLPKQELFIVADGIGGTSGGEVASEAAVTIVPLKLDKRLRKLRKNAAKTKVETVVCDVLQEVNAALVEQAREHMGGEGPGTTIVLALAWKGMFLIANLGDSRAYLWRDSVLSQLTEDHSLAAQLVRWGQITESQAVNNPGRSTLLRYLGADEELDPDFTWIMPQPGDQLLLCSDGLTGMVEDEEIAQILVSSGSLGTCCQRLIDKANRAGGKDNITAVVVRFRQAFNGSVNSKESEENPS